jgi:hypothetical protein
MISPGSLPTTFALSKKRLLDIENAILDSLTREEQLAFYLGQVVDQGIRPRVREERLISYRRSAWGIAFDLRWHEAGDAPPDTEWREDLRCAAGDLGIRLPHALVPERTGSPPPDYLAIVRQLDEHIRSALLGSLPDSHPSEAVDPQARQRPPRSEREVDPKDANIGRYQASDGELPPTVGSAADSGAADTQDMNSRIEAILNRNPHATSEKIGEEVGLTGGRIRNMAPWKNRQARRREQKAQKPLRTRSLEDEMLAVIPSKSEDPAEIAAEREEQERQEHTRLDDPEASGSMEVLRRRYIEGANPAQRARFNRMNPADQEHELKAWKFTGDRLAE